MMFLELCSKNGKRVNFEGFGTVLGKISLKIFPEIRNPLDSLLKLLEEYVFNKQSQ
jgi:hypothetical protein